MTDDAENRLETMQAVSAVRPFCYLEIETPSAARGGVQLSQGLSLGGKASGFSRLVEVMTPIGNTRLAVTVHCGVES